MKKALTLLVFILLTLVSFSQNQSDSEPKVGLVLSGGGAKGLAHIGALKVIDSLGIKVDYVAGTSMGAIIGSLYASGYSGHQLDSIFQEVDFDKLIADEIPRASKTFYERDNSEKYALTLPFDDFKIQLPSAISRGQNIYNLFSRLMLHVSDVEDFSQLPIPFFCIATNIETGEKVILDSGSLPQAAAASGALPSLFQPIYIDGNMLIDGGVVDNYPIHDLRAKGMDIIIGVDVQDDLASREELKSAPDILLQINNFRTINDMKDKSKETDIYIKPDIRDFTVVSFDKGHKIIENGQIAALEKLNELAQLKKYQKKREFAPSKSPDSIKIKQIKIKGDSKYSRSYITGKLKIRKNENLSYKDFQIGVNNLVATNNFESFIYKFKPLPDGYQLLAELTENKNKTFLKFGVHYDNLYKSAALINVTKKRILFNNDVASLDFGLGDNVRYNFEYFIDKGNHWSVGINSRYNSFHKNVNANLLSDQITGVTGLNKIDAELSDFTNQIYVQTLFRRDFSLKLGAEHKRLKLSSETIDSQIDEDETIFDKSDYFSVFGELKFDTYDNKYFPSKGFYFDGDFQLFLSSSDYNNDFSQFSYAKANIGYVFSPLQKLSVRLGSEGGFKIGDDSNTSLSFALGGYGNKPINNLIPFYGYDHISLTGNSFVKGYIDFDYEIAKNHHVNLSANYSNIGAHIFEDGEWLTSPDYSGYALGYGLETFVGPIEVKYTWSPETKKDYVFFSVGYWF